MLPRAAVDGRRAPRGAVPLVLAGGDLELAAQNARLDEELKALEQLRAWRFAQLELKLEQSAQPATHKAHREERERSDIDEVFDDY